MSNIQIKEFDSNNYRYDNLQEFLPLFIAYIHIAVDENEVVDLEDLYKPLPNKDSVDFAKIACIKDIDELISDNAKCFVLYVDDKPVSFTLFSKDDNLAKYHLELVYTAKDYKGKGYAKTLMKHAFNVLSEDAFCVTATVNSENLASQNLNSSLGLPYSMQEQSAYDDNNNPQTLYYYYHVINKQVYDLINNRAKKEQGIVFLSNNIGTQEYKLLKNMIQQNNENNIEKE